MLPEGVALLIDPAFDARVVKARAQAAFAEVGDPRPLLLLGGTPAPAPAPGRQPWLLAMLRRDATPLSLTAFVLAVLLVLAVLPTAPRRVPGSTALIPPLTDELTDAVRFGGLTPELSKRRGAYAPPVEAAAPVEAPVAEPVADEAQAGQGRTTAQARRTRRPRRTAPADVAAPLAAPTAAAAPRGPGNSGEHRRYPKAPLPATANGRPDAMG